MSTSPPPLVVGVTGKYCAGKDAVCRIFERHGFSIVDVDRLGHIVLAEQSSEVISTFGSAIQGVNGTVDRRALGQIVFSHPRKLAELESILHPAMVERVREIISSKTHDRYVINAAILHKMGLHLMCDWIVWTTAPLMSRLRRALKRDSAGAWAVLKRIHAQRKLSLQALPSEVDSYSVRNRGNLSALKAAVEALLSSKGIR